MAVDLNLNADSAFEPSAASIHSCITSASSMRIIGLGLLLASTIDALSVTRRGLAARVGAAVTGGGAASVLAYEFNVESTGVGADRNALDAPQPQQMVMPGKLDVNSATVTEYSRRRVPRNPGRAP